VCGIQRRQAEVAGDAAALEQVGQPAAQRAGVRSGVCFPIVINDRTIGTMDFFTTERITLSESRRSALRNVQQLVSQRLDIVRSDEHASRNAQVLLDSVSRLRAASQDATTVAQEAVSRAEETDQIDIQAEVRADLGEVLRSAGRHEEAARQFERALQLYERKGNVMAARHVRSQMVSLRRG